MTARDARLFSRWECIALTAAAAAMVLATGALALYREVHDSAAAFERDAGNAATQLSRELLEAQTLITALHGQFQGAREQAEAQLPDLAQRLTRSYPQVRWVGHAERVTTPKRGQFEQRMRNAGYLGFTIRPFPGARADPPSGAHLPISLVEPLTPLLARHLGVDLNGPSAWRTTIQDAIDTGDVRVIEASGRYLDSPGFLMLRATYLGNEMPASVTGRRLQASGLVLAFLDREAMLAQVIISGPDSRVVLHDGTRPAHERGGADTFAGRALSLLLGRTRYRTLELPFANLALELEVSARLQPHLGVAFVTMLLTTLLAGSAALTLRQRRQAQREERLARDRAQLAQITLHSIGDAVVRLDDDGRVQYMNPTAERMAGMALADASARPLEEIFSLELEGPVNARNLERLRQSDTPALLRNRAHTLVAVACTLTPVTDADGNSAGQVLVMRDVSREHALSRELAWQASHDPLTNLPNRREFERSLEHAVKDADDRERQHSLCYVDLDQFKIVNDTCGHAAGDRLLCQIASLLGTEMRQGDLLARLGGDEFGILLRDCPVDEALEIAKRICAKVSGFRFTWDGRPFDPGASIGVVAITEDAGTTEDVQRAADMACYAAKETGRNRAHLYRHEDHVIRRNQREMTWHTELRRALEEDRFQLHAQPIRPLRDDTGVKRMEELLLRLVDPSGDIITPAVFLPAAERYDLMNRVDRMVIDKAFALIAPRASAEHLFTINLSGQSVSDSELARYVLDAAQQHGVDPRGVCFEITETAAISNFTEALELMQTLHGAGFRFALDDFGAGVSSFGYLKQLPVDFLKIDGQFADGINADPVTRVMVSSIISVARVLQIETVAEMVEDESARRCLANLGVDYVQGYLVGRPGAMETRPVATLACSAIPVRCVPGTGPTDRIRVPAVALDGEFRRAPAARGH